MNPVDVLWVLISAALVFTMQMGFLCLEAGFTRAKNAINVAMKNALNFMITTVVFYLFAFGLMFGRDWQGLVGLSYMAMPLGGNHLAHEAMFYVFQLMFCATSAAIVSGAVAERMHLVGYGFTTLMVAGLIYPIYGHWVWGQGLDSSHSGFLGSMGFIDFAGSSVVHSGGGWVSLAGVLVLGQRTGRFDAQGRPVTIPGSNVPFATMGMLMLFFGWIGFNGGSTLELNERVPVVITNTLVAGCCGCLVAIIIDRLRTGLVSPEALINGAIAGLVAITANCHVVDTPSAMVIGAVAGAIMLLFQEVLLKLRIDDAVGAIPAHLGPGIWGTLAVALFGDLGLIGTGLSRMDQLWVQSAGAIVCGAWCFGVAYLILWITNRIRPLRISVEDEYKGLNVTEHGATTELIDLLQDMEKQVQSADLALRVHEEPFTEVGQIARLYNKVMDSLEQATSRASAIVRDMRDAVLTLAPTGAVMSLNPAAQQLFGKTERELGASGTELQALLEDDQRRPLDLTPWLQLAQRGDAAQGGDVLECLAKTASGPCPVEVSFGQAMNEKGFLTAVIRDVRARRQAQDRLYAEKQQAEFTLAAIGDAVVRCDDQGRITYMNPVAEKLTGVSSNEAVGWPLAEVVQLSSDEHGQSPIDPLAFAQKPGLPRGDYYRLYHRDATSLAVTFTPAAIHDARGQLTGYVLVIRDMSEQHKVTQALKHHANHDQLTGLANRRIFESEVESAVGMARAMDATSAGYVLAFIDLDRFKIVNDTCGHMAGDELLRRISALLKEKVRSTDLLARLGGDEFAALLRNCPMDKAEELANNWLQALRLFRFHWNGRTFSVGASIGLVRIDGSSSLKQVLADADAACYAAKTAGRDRVHVYQQDDRQLAASHREQSWMLRITEALEQHRFRLYAQKVLPTGATPHLLPYEEVMVRMVVEEEEIISPEAFLPAAERFNLASAIDRCVIEEFFGFLVKRPPGDLGGPYSLNLSGPSLENQELLGEIEHFLQQYPRLHGLVWFEVAEQQALSRFDEAVHFMQSLARYGCRFTIDHFGTSSGSISQLGMLPVHILKFDPQLIVHAIANEDRFRLVLALNQLAHALEMYSVVKFIEDQATLDRIKRFGVDYVQGQVVAPIVPLDLADEKQRRAGSGDGC